MSAQKVNEVTPSRFHDFPKTAQEVFDKVVTHLRAQAEQSIAEDRLYCAYRGKAGLKCAAGCLIPDELYSETFEKLGWKCLVHAGAVPSQHEDLISALQFKHDNYLPDYWEVEWQKLAANFGLHYTPPARELNQGLGDVVKDTSGLDHVGFC